MSHRRPGVVVISGGGTGIGLATAARFVTAGERVAIIGRRAEVLAQAGRSLSGPGIVSTYPADLTNPGEVDEVAERIEADHGAVAVIVNNAGGVLRSAEGDGSSAVRADWAANFDGNVMTKVLLTEALKPLLLRPGGRVISLSSIAALRGGGGSYSGAKAAVIGWSLDLARELGPEGVTVNVVAPGFTEGTEFFGATMTAERRARLVGETLVKRPGTPADVAAAIFYLASPEASFVTGQIIQVNGGALLGRG